MKTVLNQYSQTIVKCCASCAHKQHKDDKYRTCDIGDETVKPDYLCPNWAMHEKLNNAGRGGGRIKKKEYLMSVLDSLSKGRSSIDSLRLDFEKKHRTSIYLTK